MRTCVTPLLLLLLLLLVVVAPSLVAGNSPDSVLSHTQQQHHHRNQQQPKLSHVSILLPPDPRVAVTVEAEYLVDSCFEWRVFDPFLAKLEPLAASPSKSRGRNTPASAGAATTDAATSRNSQATSHSHSENSSSNNRQQCSPAAVVRAFEGFADKRSTFIVATDRVTGVELRCEVFFAPVAGLQILTTSRRLFVSELEELELQGFDDEENAFSSLARLPFRWSWRELKSGSLSRGGEVLQVVEAHSHTIIVNGTKPGIVQVDVTLEEVRQNKVLQPALHRSVELLVVDRLEIRPPGVLFLAPASEFRFRLFVLSQQRYSEILPGGAQQFQWQVSTPSVGSVNSLGFFGALSIGETRVTAHDVGLEQNQASSRVFVVDPVSMSLSLEPLEREEEMASKRLSPRDKKGTWNFIRGRSYRIRLHLYDRAGNEIFITQNMNFTRSLSSDILTLEPSVEDGSTVMIAKASQSGVTELSHVMHTIKSKVHDIMYSKSEGITSRQEIRVFDPVEIEWLDMSAGKKRVKELVLPFDDTIVHTYDLSVVGGSGQYVWKSTNPEIVPVNSAGVVSGMVIGSALITVEDEQNPLNNDIIRVVVSLPRTAFFSRSVREAPVNGKLLVELLFADEQKRVFHNSTMLPVSWSVSNSTVLSLPTRASDAFVDTGRAGIFPLGSSRCRSACVLLNAHHLGQTTIQARYLSLNGIKSATMIAAYDPIKISSPQTLDLVVSVGSTATVVLHNGVSRWAGDFQQLSSSTPPEFNSVMEDISFENPALALLAIRGTVESRTRVVKITCLGYHSQAVELKRVHKVPDPMALHTEELINFSFRCVNPVSAELFLRKQAERVECVETVCHVNTNSDLVAHAQLFDEGMRAFVNASTLVFDWSLTDKALGQLGNPRQLVDKEFRSLQTLSQEGTFAIQTAIHGFDHAILKSIHGLTPSVLQPYLDIAATLQVRLWHPMITTPPTAALYLHRNSSKIVNANHGSGHFDIRQLDGSQFVSMEMHPVGTKVLLRPLARGVSRISFADQLVKVTPEFTGTYVSSHVQGLKAKVPRTLIARMPSTSTIQLFADQGLEFDDDQLPWMDLTASVSEPDVLSVIKDPDHHNVFRLEGRKEGEVSVVFCIEHNPTNRQPRVCSNSHRIQIYSSLRIIPRALVLVPHADYQVGVQGGRKEDIKLTFHCDNSTVATVDQFGFVKAIHPGKTTLQVSAAARFLQASPGAEAVVMATDQITITVTDLSDGIRISSPYTHVLEGHTVPISVHGQSSGASPMSFYKSFVKFHWSTSDDSVVHIIPRIRKSSQVDESMGAASVLLQARTVGIAYIAVDMETRFHGQTLSHRASVQITVTNTMDIGVHHALLLPPGVSFSLQSHNKRHVDFNTLSCTSSAISLSPEGTIHTQDVGTAGVLASSPVEGLSSLLKVDVDHVVSSFLSRVLEIPLGSTVKLAVSTFNRHSLRFTSCPQMVVDAELNRQDVVSISTTANELTVEARTLGYAMMGVGTSLYPQPTQKDFVLVRVVNGISPLEATLLLGESLTFEANKVQEDLPIVHAVEERKGYWSTDDPSLLRVDTATGEVRAMKVGEGILRFNSEVSAMTKVRVVAPFRMTTRTPRFLTNFQSTFFQVAVDVQDETGNVHRSPVTSLSFSPEERHEVLASKCHGIVSCELLDSTARLWVSTSTRTGACSCILMTDDSFLSTLYPDEVSVQVTYQDATRQVSLSKTINFPFFPKFTVSPTEVLFTSRLKSQVVSLQPTSDHIEVSVHGQGPPHAEEVLPVQVEWVSAGSSPSSRDLVITLDDSSVTQDNRSGFILLTHNVTRQETRVPFTIDFSIDADTSSLQRGMGFWKIASLIVGSFLALYFGSLYFSRKSGPRFQEFEEPSTPPVEHPTSPAPGIATRDLPLWSMHHGAPGSRSAELGGGNTGSGSSGRTTLEHTPFRSPSRFQATSSRSPISGGLRSRPTFSSSPFQQY